MTEKYSLQNDTFIYYNLFYYTMVEKNVTTIKINHKLKKELDELKIHPRQPYEEVINMLVKYYKERNKDEK